jgi:hypothetical protein
LTQCSSISVPRQVPGPYSGARRERLTQLPWIELISSIPVSSKSSGCVSLASQAGHGRWLRSRRRRRRWACPGAPCRRRCRRSVRPLDRRRAAPSPGNPRRAVRRSLTSVPFAVPAGESRDTVVQLCCGYRRCGDRLGRHPGKSETTLVSRTITCRTPSREPAHCCGREPAVRPRGLRVVRDLAAKSAFAGVGSKALVKYGSHLGLHGPSVARRFYAQSGVRCGIKPPDRQRRDRTHLLAVNTCNTDILSESGNILRARTSLE